MNLYKIALSLLVTAAPAAARLSSDEKDSSAMMRELMTKVDAIQADNEALKNEVASLKKEKNKRRGLMPDIEGMDLPDLDLDGLDLPEEMTDILGVDPSSGGGPLTEILSGIILQLYGLKHCVGFGFDGFGRRLSSKRRLEGYGYEPICFFGGFDVNVVIDGDEFIELNADIIENLSFEHETITRELLIDSSDSNFGGAAASAEEKKAALKEKKDEFIAKHQGTR